MTTAHAAVHFSPPRPRLARVLSGGFAVGTFDRIFACTWWAVAAKVPPIRIFQSIASGLLGKSSFDGGTGTGTQSIRARIVR